MLDSCLYQWLLLLSEKEVWNQPALLLMPSNGQRSTIPLHFSYRSWVTAQVIAQKWMTPRAKRRARRWEPHLQSHVFYDYMKRHNIRFHLRISPHTTAGSSPGLREVNGQRTDGPCGPPGTKQLGSVTALRIIAYPAAEMWTPETFPHSHRRPFGFGTGDLEVLNFVLSQPKWQVGIKASSEAFVSVQSSHLSAALSSSIYRW